MLKSAITATACGFFQRSVAAGFLAVLGCFAATAEPAAPASGKNLERPNIVFIHADDLGFHDLSHNGSRLHQTPIIDTLAASGISFQQAYASYPRCVPSRYALMSARYPVNEDPGNLGAVPANANFARVLKQHGYKTYYAGKWHLGHGASSPVGFGFDESFGAGETGGAQTHHYPFNLRMEAKGENSPIPDVKEAGKPGDYLADVLTTDAIEFIDRQHKAGAPFMVMLSFYAVHTPLEAKDEDVKRNRDQLKSLSFGDGPEFISDGMGRQKMRQNHAVYAGMVENLDMNVGRVLAKLDALGITKDTIVVFSSDHGGLSNDGNTRPRPLPTTNLPLRAGKGHLYEGGLRVPLIVRWPAQLPARRDEKSVVLGMDVMPTLLDLSVNAMLTGVDGKSAEAAMLGKEDWSQRAVFWQSRKSRPYSTGDSASAAVRKGDYKLIHFFDDKLDKPRKELYNLKSDPGEKNDIAAAEPEKVRALFDELEAWRKAFKAPPAKPSYVESKLSSDDRAKLGLAANGKSKKSGKAGRKKKKKQGGDTDD